MVDTRKLKTFIKIADLTPQDTIQFADEGKLVEKDFSKNQDGSDIKTILEMMVSLNGEEPKKLTVNNTTVNILKKAWGPDSANWVNRKAKVSVVQTLAYGELKDINVLQPLEAEVAGPSPTAGPLPTPAERQVPPAVDPTSAPTTEEQAAWDDE